MRTIPIRSAPGGLSEVTLARRKWEHLGGVSQDAPDIAALKASWPEWRRNAVHIVPLEAARCRAPNQNAKR